MTVYVTLGRQKHVGTIPYATIQRPIIIPQTIIQGGNTMGNPLDTISGTITAGFVLTAVLYVLVKALV